MIIDIVVILALAMAIFKGYRNGLIIAVFSVIGFIIGLAAALKLSATVAARLGGDSSRWMPFLAFLLVFLAVVFVVNLGAKVLQTTVEWAMLGWLNRLGGIFFYSLLYAIILSVLLFYAVPLNLPSEDAAEKSAFYPYIQPIAPFVMEKMGSLIPFFKNMFTDLQNFFAGMQHKI
ncbi:MAG: CvpA family protein [Chitinophagaceae bacterium]|nr:MAG: CvpA family protein [Chitinophagaceae bacterium]